MNTSHSTLNLFFAFSLDRVLKRGRVVEIGHPEDLLRKGGIYASLAAEQGVAAALGENHDNSYTDQHQVNGDYLEQQPIF